MAITVGTEIKKHSSDGIAGVIDDFNTRVLQAVYNNAQYSADNLPLFSGTVNYGVDTVGTVAYTNSPAIEATQLDSGTIPTLTIDDTIITATTLWNAMKNLAQTLNKVRKFNAYWYHRRNLVPSSGQNQTSTSQPGAQYLVTQMSGIAIFKSGFPEPTGGQDVYSVPTGWWTKT